MKFKKEKIHIVLLVFHPSKDEDFKSDMNFCLISSELKKRGIKSKVGHIYFERNKKKENLRHLKKLVIFLKENKVEVIILDNVWGEEIIKFLRKEFKGKIVFVDPFSNFRKGSVDFIVLNFNTNIKSIINLCEVLINGGDIKKVPDLIIFENGIEYKTPVEKYPEDELPFEPALDILNINDDFNPKTIRKTLCVNTGCTYGLDVRKNEFFKNLKFEDFVSKKGCSFCHQGGDYRGRSVENSAQKIFAQIVYLQNALEKLDEIIIRDQNTIRYLPYLAALLVKNKIKPLSILFSARADYVVRYFATLEKALKILEKTPYILNLYLIGFENLSNKELYLYNKGFNAKVCEKALIIARDLGENYPENFIYDKYPTSSFILFNPWTEIDNLKENIELFRKLNILDFSTGMGLTKLRLYPNLPLFYKAKSDGLLTMKYEKNVFDSGRRFGYGAEYPWKFRNPTVGLIYEINAFLSDIVQRRSQIDLLEWVIKYVENGLKDVEGLNRCFKKIGKLNKLKMESKTTEGSIEIPLGTSCNNNCKYCIQKTDVFEPQKRRIKFLMQNEKKHYRCIFKGREPTLSPKFFEFLKIAKNEGFKNIEVVSNGRLFSYKQFLKKCYQDGLNAVRIKIFHCEKKKYDEYSKVHNGFEDFLNGIKNISQRPDLLKMDTEIIITEDNVNELEKIEDFLTNFNISHRIYKIPINGIPHKTLLDFIKILTSHFNKIKKSSLSFSIDAL